MPVFKYLAFDNKGRKKEGVIEAQSKYSAIAVLKKNGIYVRDIDNVARDRSFSLLNLFTIKHLRRVNQKDRSDMFFQLATLIDTGVPLAGALEITSQQSTNTRIKNALMNIRDKVSEGTRLSLALYNHRDIFTESYIKMIEIAEKTGKLADVLFKISKREEERISFNQKITPLVLYPAFVLMLGVGIVSFLLAYVVPKMEKIFSFFHKKLPFVTRMLIVIGLFMKHYFLVILVFFVVVIAALRLLYIRSDPFRKIIEELLLKIALYRKVVVAQFASNLAFQLSADIKLVDAIKSSSYVVNNFAFIKLMESVAEDINTGVAIDKAFEEAGVFDSMFIAALKFGKKTGRLSDFIQRVSVYYDKKLDTMIKTAVSLIEPAAILLLGLVVGFIVMSVMVPLFNINQLIKY